MLATRPLLPGGMFALGLMLVAGPGQAANQIESVAIASESSNEVVRAQAQACLPNIVL
jgi:hypothetical protein